MSSIARVKLAAQETFLLWDWKLYVGTRPAGHNGHLGQVKPTPDELTYPPMKISVKGEDRLACRYIVIVPLAVRSCMDEQYNEMDSYLRSALLLKPVRLSLH